MATVWHQGLLDVVDRRDMPKGTFRRCDSCLTMYGLGVHPALLAVVAAAVLAACGSRAAPTTTPAPAPATPIPVETPDASMTAALQDNIVLVHGEKPRPGWYKFLMMVNKRPELAIFGTAAWIAAKPGISAKVATTMCVDIAGVAFDENAVPIGFRHVHIDLLRDPAVRIADVYLDLDVIASCDTRT